MKTRYRFGLFLLLLPAVSAPVFSQDRAPERVRDVVYGRKHGMLLSMDVLKPANPTGVGVLWMVSGGWFSSHAAINPGMMKPFLDRGQTVFTVVHGSAPKFTVPEILPDIDLATRFVRLHAAEYDVDPNRLGISGASAGGHLSLMQGARGKAGDPNGKEPLDRQSSKVQAVACFFPPTDWLNYSKPGQSAFTFPLLERFVPTFGAKSNDPAEQERIAREISPIQQATKDMPPTMIIHGDKDELVPIQQAEVLIARLKELGVKATLVTKPGVGHGWPTIGEDVKTLAEFLDENMPRK